MSTFDMTDPDEGTLCVQLADGKAVTLDVYCVQNQIHELGKEFEGKPAHEFHGAVVKLMNGLGLPNCTHRVADKFVQAVAGEAKRLEGFTGDATGSPAESPASTASTPSTGP